MQSRMLVAVAVVFVIQVSGLKADDWWVDSLGSGDGMAPGTPVASVQVAIDAAAAGDTINIRGGGGQLYTNQYYRVDKENLTLRDWEAKPVFQLLGTSDSISNRLLEIQCSGVTLSNLTFRIQGAVMGDQDSLIEITTNELGGANNVTFDGCEFTMTAFGGHHNQRAPIFQNLNPDGTNIQVRSCRFTNWDREVDPGGFRVFMIQLDADYSQITGNTFSNVCKILDGEVRYGRFTSNLVLNVRNNVKIQDGTDGSTSSMILGKYGTLQDIEISYNRVWNNNGRLTSFIGKTRNGFNGATRIFNNTIYNVDSFAPARYFADAERWSPLIYNNLMVNSATTNLYSHNTNAVPTSAFKPETEVRNNLWYGGANALTNASVGTIVMADNFNVACVFLNTTDPAHPDFLRPDANQSAQVLLGIGGSYPSYIGALVPQAVYPKGTVISIQ